MALDLIADIGGTNARFALTDAMDPARPLLAQQVLPCADFGSLQHAAQTYLAQVGARPQRAAIAVACPVTGDAIRLTNRAWSFSQSELRGHLGLQALKVLNDFGAVAHAVPALGSADRHTLHGDPSAPLLGPVSVLGPGTGLGVGLLVGSRERGWQVVETEGGHVSFAPIGDEEARIHRWLSARYGRTSTERLLCGAGLSHIDAVLALGDEAPRLDALDAALRDPAEIVAAALAGTDLNARRALARFCAVLGSVAGDTALIHGARTVMIAGGIVPRFIPFLETSAFRERFLAKGRFAAHLEGVAIHAITHPQPGLLGAAVALSAG
ncbi:MAG: glucokinase [Xanthomonadales bacterium]|jgi:glucokinase|nr:glucokinase [Xanthomonadales bacterium]